MKTLAAFAISAALLAGCATNGASTIPSTTQANLSANALQLAVGTANINGTTGLNVVTTLRQPNGKSGVLADVPTLTGPAGFTVPANAPGAYGPGCLSFLACPNVGASVDAGTSHISGSPQVTRTNVGLKNTTFGTFTGVYSYGFGPYNCDQNCTNLGAFFPGNPNSTTGNGFLNYSLYDCYSAVCYNAPVASDVALVQPFYIGPGNGFEFIVGSPAVPFFNDGTYPLGFAGYSPGFTTFDTAPVAGQYTLNVNVPAQNANPIGYTASATLANTAALGNISVAVNDTSGGGLGGTVNVPGGVTETEVFVIDVHTDPNTGVVTQTNYTVGPIAGTGTQNWTLPGNLGPCAGSNCQNNAATQTPSLQSGDTYFVVAVGYDYPAFEAMPPGNTQQKPTIVGSNSQADLTMSDPSFGGGQPYP